MGPRSWARSVAGSRVPAQHHRRLALEAEHRHGGGVEPQVAAVGDRQVQPARREGAQRVTVPEDQYPAVRRPAPGDDAVEPGRRPRPRSRRRAPARSRSSSRGRSRGSPRWSRPRGRRSPTRRGRRRPRPPGVRPAARSRGRAAGARSARGRSRRRRGGPGCPAATRSPSAVRGRSVVEVCRPSRLHSVSPCRTSQTSSHVPDLHHAPSSPHAHGRATMRAHGDHHPAQRGGPRARIGWRAAGAFFTQGFVFISLTTKLPTVQDHWGYSDTTLSLLLLMMVLLAGLGSRARRDRVQAGRQRGDPAGRAARDRGRRPDLRAGSRPGRSSSPRWRSTASRSARWTPPPTCRRWRSSTSTTGRSCRRSTAPGRWAG